MNRKPLALLSVFNKHGIVEFAQGLIGLGFGIISSGGTAAKLKEAGVPVTDVAELSGLGPILDHRVVTLVPEVHGGLLALEKHLAELEEHRIPWIDLVCVDLYPLKDEIAKPTATRESVIEKTDIGGPTMLSSGAKGRRVVVCDPADRARVLDWLKAGRPDDDAFVTALAAKADGLIADYRLASARYHSGGDIDGFVGTKAMALRYGENPNFMGAYFAPADNHPLAVQNFRTEGGSAPSFINMTDLIRARRTLMQIVAGWQENFQQTPHVAIAVKHGNACGVGVSASSPQLAMERMIDGDRTSIFGAVVLVNFPVTETLANVLRTHGVTTGKRILDGVLAPSFDEGASAALERKEGKCRMLSNPALRNVTRKDLPRVLYRHDDLGGFLRQEGEPFVLDLNDPEMEKNGGVALRSQEDLVLAWAIGSTSVSNTITIVKDGMLVANAVGQQSRVRAAKLALMIAKDCGHDLGLAVAYSDSFFPEPDAPVVLSDAGIMAVFASSGSVKDDLVRAACVDRKMSLWRLPDKKCRGFFHH